LPFSGACGWLCGVSQGRRHIQETSVKPEELKKLDAYFKKTFSNSAIQVKARPRKDDSAEVFIGEDFLGLLYRDDEDGDLSYNFSMAILEVDLD
jgi:Protein of unknown function (DUF3126)